MTDKPLHVQVAEALGWPSPEFITNEGHDPNRPIYGWRKCYREHAEGEDCEQEHLWHCGTEDFFKAPDYDTDWSATGPLIEKYKIDIFSPRGDTWMAQAWRPNDLPQETFKSSGMTPLEAVCSLILKLKAVEKL